MMVKSNIRLVVLGMMMPMLFVLLESCGGKQTESKGSTLLEKIESAIEGETPDEYNPVNTLLVLPANPAPGEDFKILATGGRNIKKATITVKGANGKIESKASKSGDDLPCWRIDDFAGNAEGKYIVTLTIDDKEVSHQEFVISNRAATSANGMVWKTTRSWDSNYETIYSAWVNALFKGCNEQSSWSALHEVTQNKENNFLYNFLSLNEDAADSKNKVQMEPDCADNPFFLRAYFAWKLGLPFGYHICDRGYLGKNPHTGQWITNESATAKANRVQAFNSFIRNIMNGVHSGTARTGLDNNNSDYYPVSLERSSLRPGTVYADPYGHTLIVVSWIAQTKNKPGLLLSVDAQPDKSVAIKRFWKGNFLFSTSEVVGEPGFKAFRPIIMDNGNVRLMTNEELGATSGFVPFSLQQKKMDSDTFYLAMERIINPKPLDPEEALTDLIKALHEQLLVRVKSVANGEAYMKAHPGTIIPMPTSSNGIFQAGGSWEDFSTPNRDLRLLIAMDAVLGFPERVAKYPGDFDVSKTSSPEEIKKQLQLFLDDKVAELTISYTRSDGSAQELTIAEILKRRDAFEMAYNPNDCAEIRWGAPEKSTERSTCKRQTPANQQKTMQVARKWFSKRLHPPT